MLCTLVTREQPYFQAPFEGHVVLLCTKVIRQIVPDCRTLHRECLAANSGEPVSWHRQHDGCRDGKQWASRRAASRSGRDLNCNQFTQVCWSRRGLDFVRDLCDLEGQSLLHRQRM